MRERDSLKIAGCMEEFDIVCVGAGAGGLASAIAAADLGLRTIVLEQAPRIGGNTAWSYGIVWAGDTHLAQAEGIEDSPVSTQAYLDYLGGGRNDAEVTRSYIEHSPAAIRYFETEVGIPFYVVKNLPDHYYPLGTARFRKAAVYRFGRSKLRVWARGVSAWSPIPTATVV